jgi:hypothetical protein
MYHPLSIKNENMSLRGGSKKEGASKNEERTEVIVPKDLQSEKWEPHAGPRCSSQMGARLLG